MIISMFSQPQETGTTYETKNIGRCYRHWPTVVYNFIGPIPASVSLLGIIKVDYVIDNGCTHAWTSSVNWWVIVHSSAQTSEWVFVIELLLRYELLWLIFNELESAQWSVVSIFLRSETFNCHSQIDYTVYTGVVRENYDRNSIESGYLAHRDFTREYYE